MNIFTVGLCYAIIKLQILVLNISLISSLFRMSDLREVTTNGQTPVIALNGQCLSIRIDDVRLKGPCRTAWSVGGSSIDGSDRFKSTANYTDENICDYILLEIKKVVQLYNNYISFLYLSVQSNNKTMQLQALHRAI